MAGRRRDIDDMSLAIPQERNFQGSLDDIILHSPKSSEEENTEKEVLDLLGSMA
jgi:hypothetical protein